MKSKKRVKQMLKTTEKCWLEAFKLVLFICR